MMRSSTASRLTLVQTVQEPEEESFDIQELASETAEMLEAYQRAPWRQLSDEVRIARLRRAIALLKRIEHIESGRATKGF